MENQTFVITVQSWWVRTKYNSSNRELPFCCKGYKNVQATFINIIQFRLHINNFDTKYKQFCFWTTKTYLRISYLFWICISCPFSNPVLNEIYPCIWFVLGWHTFLCRSFKTNWKSKANGFNWTSTILHKHHRSTYTPRTIIVHLPTPKWW